MGDLTFLEVRLAQGRPDRRADLASGWGGGGALRPRVHAIALALLLAAPARVVEVEADVLGDDDLVVDDDATVTLTFDTGLRAQVRATWRAAAPVVGRPGGQRHGAVRLELVPDPTVEVNGVALRLPPAPDGIVSPQLHHLGYTAQLATVTADVDGATPAAVRPGVRAAGARDRQRRVHRGRAGRARGRSVRRAPRPHARTRSGACPTTRLPLPAPDPRRAHRP